MYHCCKQEECTLISSHSNVTHYNGCLCNPVFTLISHAEVGKHFKVFYNSCTTRIFILKVKDSFDVHVTVHRDKFLIINQLDTSISQIYFGMKLHMLRTVPLSIIRSFSLHTRQWYMSYRFADKLCTRSGCADNLQAGSGCSILILFASCQQTCMTYTIAVCTVENS